MPHPPPAPGVEDHLAKAPAREARASTPRWVVVFGIVALAAALAFVIVHIAGGGLHRHLPSPQELRSSLPTPTPPAQGGP